MSPVTLNLVAIAIFTVTMTSLLGGLIGIPPAVPAVITFGLLSAATVDTLALDGRTGTLLVDGFSQFSSEHRQRVVRHEAGHFLVAHLLGIPVTGYTLSAWEAFRRGQRGHGGVSFDTQSLDQQMAQGKLSAQTVDQYCTVWMAGIAAEQLVYGTAVGGDDDRQTLRLLWQQFRRPQAECDIKARWSLLKARTLLESHQAAYEQLVQAMEQRCPVAECLDVLTHCIATDPATDPATDHQLQASHG